MVRTPANKDCWPPAAIVASAVWRKNLFAMTGRVRSCRFDEGNGAGMPLSGQDFQDQIDDLMQSRVAAHGLDKPA
jgi:hypothetical protein